ncbi:MAG: tryptophan 2,3-dioxygenase family protein [Schleiferiaceae bacterium]|nr:tryptophan 2,3-dioxygenase family protein [Schleiferiaceae bacterium]MDG1220004.1 tryptophan 2,3-dioxygenase family protein [Schleiferiaceae bacterium]MDG2225780.1 tryptophan 2,3-dioxygenase family protein [Schleiferiaceae bacterium]
MESELKTRIDALEAKYAVSGQALLDYLDGLVETDYLKYWDYIHLDTLLSLQSPRTKHHDEPIFIMYHQITELYFKLCLHELKDVIESEGMDATLMEERLRRCNTYFKALDNSFSIMVDGMDRKQFLKFRMALLPASGFQSAQYRMIEMACAPLNQLVHIDHRQEMAEEKDVSTLFKKLYWQSGATIAATGEKTLTLIQFEEKYAAGFQAQASQWAGRTVSHRMADLTEAGKMTEGLREQARAFDRYVNVLWPLSHYKSAVRYLAKKPADVRATGGTNWQKYLPPRMQLRIFFPHMWTQTEKDAWGTLPSKPSVNK